MSYIISKAQEQAGKIREQRAELSRISGQIDLYFQQLSQHWKATEMQYVHNAFSKVKQDVEKALSILNNVDDTLIQTARMIDEERQRALEAERKAAAEKAAGKK